ncbi:LysR substrate-binding domain-containing protein [Thalassospira sp. MCCC 1A03138]|uniref:LysR substrate-binding domain-containing protein n=1 Tax=Thalassospira sp. MCCC 1A03138 TaxID=1470576 RepID=UPI000A1D614F|nr:LysR substrate-binding domain-containing protein [Thalassospira sp. MCCC 1A03138]
MASRITIRQVEAFRLLMTSGTMTEAAERMSISQPAVSRLISDLEATLDMRLFERSGPRLQATPAASRLVGEVNRVFVGLDFVEEAARRIRRFPMDPFRIAAPPFLSHTFVAHLVASVVKEIPELTISLHTDDSHAIADQISRGEHDLGFCTLGPVTQDIRVMYRAVIGSVALIPSDHPLASKSTINEFDLDGENIFVLGRSGAIRPQINEIFEKAQVELKIAGEVLHASSCASFVAEGLGIAILNTISARMAPEGRTVIRPFSPAVTQEFAAITPSRVTAPRITDAFVRHLPEVLEYQGRIEP